jgi:phosphate transport system permease protein
MMFFELKRKIKNKVFQLACYLFVGLTGIVLVSILYSLFKRGLSTLDLNFFIKSAPSPGEVGGLAHAILGSLIINTLAILISTVFGLLIATYLSEYSYKNKLSKVIIYMNELLMSVPSILMGLFVYVIAVETFKTYSALAGALSLSLIALPIILKISHEMLVLIPQTLREACLALGIPKWKMICLVVWKVARPGILTGTLLGLARVSGETAPLLFTALNNHFWSFDIFSPMANLPVSIYQFATSPYKNWQNLA